MARVFLSFLGTNRYTPCNYVFGSRRVDNVKYIQEALSALFCDDFTDQDRVLIFLTPAAERKNWLTTDDGPGLEEALRKRLPDTRLIPKRIPEGVSETEIWQIFQIVYDGLEEGDEVIYDVTHGFRSLPILGMSLLNYARYLKNIKILGIYYGAFEALGPAGEVASLAMEKRDAPVFNLTSFDTLQQWSLAADNFTQFGITEKLSNLISRETGPALKETKGKHEQAQNEKKLAEALRRISGLFHTVRGKEIIDGSLFFATNNLLDKMNLDELVAKPVGPIIGKIKTKIENFKKEDLDNGFRAVQWCIDHRLIQQGITLLQEMIITHILKFYREDIYGLIERETVSMLFNFHNSLLPEDPEDRLYRRRCLVQKMFGTEPFCSLAPLYNSLRDYRNDINHAGLVGGNKKNKADPLGEEKFEKKLSLVFSGVIDILQRS